MMKRLISWMYTFLMFSTLAISLILFCTTTTPGLYLSLKAVEYFLPGTLKVKGLQGRLADDLKAKKLVYEDNDIKITLKEVALKWQLKTLLKLNLKAQNLKAGTLIIDKKRQTQPPPVPHLPFNIELQHLKLGTLKIKHSSSKISDLNAHDLNFNRKNFQVNTLEVKFNDTHIHAKARGQTVKPYQENLHIELTPLQNNGLKGQIHLEGDQFSYHFLGQIKAPGQIKIEGDLKNQKDVFAKIKWANMVLFKPYAFRLESAEGHGELKGKLNHLILDLNSQFQRPFLGHMQTKLTLKDELLNVTNTLSTENGILKLQLSHVENYPWQGQIDAKDLDFSHDAALKNVNLSAQFKGDTLDNLEANARYTATYYQEKIQGTVEFKNKKTKAQLSSPHIQVNLEGTLPYIWQFNAKVSRPEVLFPKLKGLQSQIQVQAQLENAQKGSLNLNVSEGLYLMNGGKNPPQKFKGGAFKSTLTAKGLKASGELSIDGHQKLVSHFDLPQFNLETLHFAQQRVQGDVTVLINDIGFLEKIFPILYRPQGDLNIKLLIAGLLSKPEFSGDISLKNAQTQIKKFGLTLQPIEANLKTKNNTWDFKGAIYSEKVPLLLTGQGSILPFDGEINLKGQSVPIIHLSQYQFNASPNAQLIFKDKTLSLSGDVLIPEASIKPVTFSNVVTLPQETRFVDRTNPTDSTLPFYLDLNLKAGDNVILDTKGLSGKLQGNLNLNYTPQSTLVAAGELSIKDGKYRAFGQNLILQHGELIYAGGSIETPGIRLRAVRHFNHTTQNFSGSNHLFDFNSENVTPIDFSDKTTVGIEANGPMNNPKIKLFSIPANLSQSDILSLLVLGRPASQASQASGQLLLTAISSMNLESGTGGVQLLQQLKEDTGLDFNIQNNPSLDQQSKQVTDNTSFVLSKTITNRLILSYNIGLMGTDNNVLTLRYLLNQFFSLQVNTGVQGSGFDLLYTQSKDSVNE